MKGADATGRSAERIQPLGRTTRGRDFDLVPRNAEPTRCERQPVELPRQLDSRSVAALANRIDDAGHDVAYIGFGIPPSLDELGERLGKPGCRKSPVHLAPTEPRNRRRNDRCVTLHRHGSPKSSRRQLMRSVRSWIQTSPSKTRSIWISFSRPSSVAIVSRTSSCPPPACQDTCA